MRASERKKKERIEGCILTFLNICFKDGTSNTRAYNKTYLHGCRREGFFAFKVGNTMIEKWCGDSISPFRASKEYQFYNDLWGQLGYVEIFLEIEHDEFLATVEVKVSGGDDGQGNWIGGNWVSHVEPCSLVKFRITYCQFVGDIEVLETEALLANLSHDFS